MPGLIYIYQSRQKFWFFSPRNPLGNFKFFSTPDWSISGFVPSIEKEIEEFSGYRFKIFEIGQIKRLNNQDTTTIGVHQKSIFEPMWKD